MYVDVIEALVATCRPVPELEVVLDYEPNALHVPVGMYFFLDHFVRSSRGQVVANEWYITGRILVAYQSNETAERTLEELVNKVPIFIEADQTLGLDRTLVQVEGGKAEYREVAGVVYRSCDLTIRALQKGVGGEV